MPDFRYEMAGYDFKCAKLAFPIVYSIFSDNPLKLF